MVIFHLLKIVIYDLHLVWHSHSPSDPGLFCRTNSTQWDLGSVRVSYSCTRVLKGAKQQCSPCCPGVFDKPVVNPSLVAVSHNSHLDNIKWFTIVHIHLENYRRLFELYSFGKQTSWLRLYLHWESVAWSQHLRVNSLTVSWAKLSTASKYTC